MADREVPTPGGGGMYSTTADMVRYVTALLRIIAGEQDSVLRPETLATMFRPLPSQIASRAWVWRSNLAGR